MSILKERVTKDNLIAGLSEIPDSWALTPVNGKKAPYRTDWQHESPLSRDELTREIQSGKAQGYGFRTGKISGGIVAIDCDGEPAHELAESLGGLPPTVSFTSGKPGRAQYLCKIPPEFWDKIKTKKLKTGKKGPDGKEVMLELRWGGCQSVLPPSMHPETGQYQWINSPQKIAIADAPEWVIQQMLVDVPRPLPFIAPSEPVPLMKVLSVEHRQMIEAGVSEGGRNDAGAALARDLIGTSNRLDYLGHRCEDNPRDLFDQYCDRCNPPLPAGERETIWNKAEGDNPTPCLSDDKIENCIKAHRRQPLNANGQPIRQVGVNNINPELPRLKRERMRIEAIVGNRLRFNEMTLKVEIDGETMDFECPEMELAERFNIEMKGTERQKDAIILAIAKKNSYHPFQKYLLDCHQKHKDTRILKGIAERYFGTNDPIHQEYVKRFLIAIVARVMRPGCKHDTAFILQGPQGWKKSTFLRTLVGDPFFCDDMGDYTNKDELLKFLTHVLTEWAELETQIGRKKVSQLKAFLATETFSVRPPYARRSSEFSVRGVIAGSTNESEFLTDSTGNRRIWVVPVLQPIPISLLESERDRIFGAAVELFLQGERWWLTPEEQKLSDLANQQFTELSALDQFVAEYLDGKTDATTAEILDYLKIKEITPSFGDTARMAGPYIRKAAEKAGWKQARIYRKGKPVRGYKCPQPTPANDPSIHQRSIADPSMDRPETPLQQAVWDTDPSDPSKTANSVNSFTDRADTPDRTDTPQSEPPRSPSDDPPTVGGDHSDNTRELVPADSTSEAEEKIKEMIRKNAIDGGKRIKEKDLVSSFEHQNIARAALDNLVDQSLVEIKKGHIAAIRRTDSRSPFAKGKRVIVTKNDDPRFGLTGTIVKHGNGKNYHVMVDGTEEYYSVKDLEPFKENA